MKTMEPPQKKEEENWGPEASPIKDTDAGLGDEDGGIGRRYEAADRICSRR